MSRTEAGRSIASGSVPSAPHEVGPPDVHEPGGIFSHGGFGTGDDRAVAPRARGGTTSVRMDVRDAPQHSAPRFGFVRRCV